MDQPPPSSDEQRVPPQRTKMQKAGRKAARLSLREYLPMALTIAFWAIVALSIGHADTARLLAATVLLRAPILLSQMNTRGPLARQAGAPKEVRRRSARTAILIQLGILLAITGQVALLSLLLVQLDQPAVAAMLVLGATGIPARLIRSVVRRAMNYHIRLYLAASALAGAGIAYALDAGPLGYALAFGAREWVATAACLLFDPGKRKSRVPSEEPVTFAEVAKNTVVTSRKLLTYRLTKNILTIFGPFGNFAARTGRGFNLHTRLEPYIPHSRIGFALFALVTAAIAVVLMWRSGEPLAMIGAAGALQLSAVACNVLLWWRYLPVRDDPTLVVEDDDDD